MRPLVLLLIVLASTPLHADSNCRITFRDAAPNYPYGWLAHLVDLNRDGNLDYVGLRHTPSLVTINRGRADGSFRPAGTISVASDPVDARAADFDGDGFFDIALTTLGDGMVSFYFGKADGTWELGFAADPVLGPTALEVNDFNRDGKPDVAVVSAWESRDVVAILLNSGGRSFTNAGEYISGQIPNEIVSGDLNGDGFVDLAIASMERIVTILAGKGDGTFSGSPWLSAAANPFTVRMHDIDKDGDLDVLVTDAFAFVVSVHEARGDGTFEDRVDYPAGGYSQGLGFADMDGDGKTDVVVGNSIEDTVMILRGNGDGTLQPGVRYLAGMNAARVHVADLDHDSRSDIIVTNIGSISVLRNMGGGRFVGAPSGDFGFNSTLAAVSADFDEDGIADVAAGVVGRAALLLSNGDGSFRRAAEIPTAGYTNGIVTGDFNRDGHADVVSVASEMNFASSSLMILLGDGKGGLTPSLYTEVVKDFSNVGAGDFNGDGALDVVISSSKQDLVMLHPGKGDGTLHPPVEIRDVEYPTFAELEDLNGDGRDDLVVLNLNAPVEQVGGSLVSHLSNGDGTFTRGHEVPVDLQPLHASFADFNHDEAIDVVVSDFTTGSQIVYLGDGGGKFSLGDQQRVFAQSPASTVGDFNRDGHLDFAASGLNFVAVFPGRGDGTFETSTNALSGLSAYAVVAGDYDRDGDDDMMSLNYDTQDYSVLINDLRCHGRGVRR